MPFSLALSLSQCRSLSIYFYISKWQWFEFKWDCSPFFDNIEQHFQFITNILFLRHKKNGIRLSVVAKKRCRLFAVWICIVELMSSCISGLDLFQLHPIVFSVETANTCRNGNVVAWLYSQWEICNFPNRYVGSVKSYSPFLHKHRRMMKML